MDVYAIRMDVYDIRMDVYAIRMDVYAIRMDVYDKNGCICWIYDMEEWMYML